MKKIIKKPRFHFSLTKYSIKYVSGLNKICISVHSPFFFPEASITDQQFYVTFLFSGQCSWRKANIVKLLAFLFISISTAQSQSILTLKEFCEWFLKSKADCIRISGLFWRRIIRWTPNDSEGADLAGGWERDGEGTDQHVCKAPDQCGFCPLTLSVPGFYYHCMFNTL